MNNIIARLVLDLLGRILTKEMVQKYETQLLAFLEAELANGPQILQPIEQWFVCKLYAMAQADGSPIGQEAVQVVAQAFGVDTSTCPKA